MRKNLLLLALTATVWQGTQAQSKVDVDYRKYPDYTHEVKPDARLLKQRNAVSGVKRPSRVNNAETPYFPPVFNQDGGSCGSASRIGYMFTYEINAYRGADASLPINQYPTHFTWLLTNSNSGKEQMAAANGIPNLPTYGGRTYSRLFGNQDTGDTDFGWMQGYDKWFAAMQNRIEGNANMPISVETEEGRELLKNWLWNHNGDTDFKAGGVCGIGLASGGQWLRIPKTPANDANGVTGQYYVGKWGKTVDHALTIVGYDDNIEFDLNGNGIVGEKEADEVGAWIVVNSWGNTWCNSGFIYCPYHNAVPAEGSTDYYRPEIYHVRKNYRPLRTFKILMEYSKRSELRISAGIAANLDAEMPERSVQFEHFRFAGDGNNDNVDAEVPMLGRWADGMHYEPMEFGYDLTDLSSNFDTGKPLKYFLVIETKPTANGQGKVDGLSLMDYTFDRNGVEIPAELGIDGVTIKTQGQTTYISVIVPGSGIYAPRNLRWENSELRWDAPSSGPYLLTGYQLYKDGSKVADLPASTTQYTPTDTQGDYRVKALYDNQGTTLASALSNPTLRPYAGKSVTSNYIRKFSGGFVVNNLFDQPMPKATIEFWLRPTVLTDYNMMMGTGWGKFLLHSTSDKRLVVGWDTGNRITSDANTLKVGTWNHVAVVIDGGEMTAYVNGQNVGAITTGQNGLPAIGNFMVGREDANSVSGLMDEFRVWSCARTMDEIKQTMYAAINNPQSTPYLECYLPMDEPTREVLIDHAKGHTISLLGTTHQRYSESALLKDTRTLKADFALPSSACYVGRAVTLTNLSSDNAVRWVWDADGSDLRNTEVKTPSMVFANPGDHTIQLTVYDGQGQTNTVTKTLTVLDVPAPQASFTHYPEAVAAGQHMTLSATAGDEANYAFQWSCENAQVALPNQPQTTITFDRPGKYTVRLTVTNSKGTNTTEQTVTVEARTPVAQFDVTPSVMLKGETARLRDESLYEPTQWKWSVTSDAMCSLASTPHVELANLKPGRYQVALTVGNEMGENTLIKKNAITVCNADGEHGLNFYGNQETVTFDNPLATSTSNLTVEWWMYSKKNVHNGNGIGHAAEDLLITTQGNGALSVQLGGKTFTTPAGTVVEGEWHHYAVVYNQRNLMVYRDGRVVSSSVTMPSSTTLPTQWLMGGADHKMNALVDEFRVWNKALSKRQLEEVSNAPITDVTAAEAQGLRLYYNFNQNEGNVVDATSGGHTGVRTNFGPEGDAWSVSLGIFCLNFDEPTDVTAKYLTNVTMPFLKGTGTVNTANSARFATLRQQTADSGWKVEDAVVNNGVTTGIHVDVNKASAMTLTTSWDGFASSLSDHRVYQTITLPKGYYTFSVEGYQEFAAAGSYLAVAAGNTLPVTADLATNALAYSTLEGRALRFMIDQEQEVSLGMVFNMSGKNCITFRSFTLKQLTLNEILPDPTGVQQTTATTQGVSVKVDGSGVTLFTSKPTPVSIYTLYGTTVYAKTVNGSDRVQLPKGVYVVQGQKFIVR